jgi:hypothetical protein
LLSQVVADDDWPVRAVLFMFLFMFLFLFVFSPTRVSSAAAPPPRVQAFMSLCFVFLFSQRSFVPSLSWQDRHSHTRRVAAARTSLRRMT